MKRRLLVVAAEEFELAPLRMALAGRGDAEYVFVAGGPGPRLAGLAVDRAGPIDGFDGVISAGICGALDEDLKIESIVVGRAVNGVAIPGPAACGDCKQGPVASVDYVACTREQRRRLRSTGAIAVDMESAAVLERARAAGRPFFCIKAVSDGAGEEFVIDLNAARDSDGRFSAARILRQAVRSPAKAIPEMVRLKRNSERAAKALGEFVAHCYF
jgi:hypothetical protein